MFGQQTTQGKRKRGKEHSLKQPVSCTQKVPRTGIGIVSRGNRDPITLGSPLSRTHWKASIIHKCHDAFSTNGLRYSTTRERENIWETGPAGHWGGRQTEQGNSSSRRDPVRTLWVWPVPGGIFPVCLPERFDVPFPHFSSISFSLTFPTPSFYCKVPQHHPR